MKYIHILFLAVVLAACSSDDVDFSSTAETMRLQLPNIELVMEQPQKAMEQQSTTRTGDPGVDDELKLPDHVYVFMWVKQSDGKYMIYYIHRHDVAEKWVENADPDKPDNRRYKLENEGDYTIATSAVSADAGAIGKWYVIASNKELTNTEIQAVYTGLPNESSIAIGEPTLKDIVPDPDKEMRTSVFNLSSWTSTDLRDLYSNPIGDTEVDDKGYHNGEIRIGTYTDDSGETKTGVLHGDVRLYHVAAKVDFKWEVPSDKQETTSVEKITVSNLPTKCKIFEPTNNPEFSSTSGQEHTAMSHTITTDPGNKWIGREYFYALEPRGGKIDYEVEINGRTGTVSQSFTPATKDNVFTGWYRINAMVK